MDKRFIDFVKKCKTPHHFIKFSTEFLKNHNFLEYNDGDDFKPGRYYKIEDTMLIVFTIPEGVIKSCKMIVAHNDSPVLKIKQGALNKFMADDLNNSKNNLSLPNVNLNNKERLGVNNFIGKNDYLLENSLSDLKFIDLSTYGGGIWHTWFDKPLSVGGKVVDIDGNSKIVEFEEMLIIPSLPIHLDHNMYKDGFTFNKEKHLKGVFLSDGYKNITQEILEYFNHNKITSYDLSVYDSEGPIEIGQNKQLLNSPRLDNLVSSYIGLEAIIDSNEFCVLAVFDSEEIGSATFSGACSKAFFRFIEELFRKINKTPDFYKNSFVISADVSHGFNPLYSEYYSDCTPKIGNGVSIKYSTQYATNINTSSFIKNLAIRNNIKIQSFQLKNTIRGGGTIGPIICCKLGIKTVDVGTPILAMHSSRETMAKIDLKHTYDLFKAFYQNK